MERLEWITYFVLGGCLALSAWRDARTRTISVRVCLVFAVAGIALGWRKRPF